MKFSLTIFLAAAVIALAFFSFNTLSVNEGIDIESIVTCKGCKKK